MLKGKIPMPDSNYTMMGTDPIAFFNRLRNNKSVNANPYGFEDVINTDGKTFRRYKYNFIDGEIIISDKNKKSELKAHEFYFGGYIGELLGMRTPLTHHAQVRKFNCISEDDKIYWNRYLNQLILFNAFDETNLGLGGADYDGDALFLTKLFVDKFQSTDYIIFNNNDTGIGSQKVILSESELKSCVRRNLIRNQLGQIVNQNSRIQELLNDTKSLEKFVNLANYKDDWSFGFKNNPKMPYAKYFCNIDTAKEYLESLNHSLTTLAELEVDKPKTGYMNRYNQNQKEYTVPFYPLWFSSIKGELDYFLNLQPEEYSENAHHEPIRKLSRKYNNDSLIKVILDTKKVGVYGPYVQRTIEMMADNNSIMSNIYKYVLENIIKAEPDIQSCYDISESLRTATNLDLDEADRIFDDVVALEKQYRKDIASYIYALKQNQISCEEFDLFLENLINDISEQLRILSDDRTAIAFAAYFASSVNKNGTQSFPFVTCTDGMVALLDNLNDIQYMDIVINDEIPYETKHIIVYRKQYRLPETFDEGKTYLGEMNLPNGSYEIHRNLKGKTSLIVPKTISKSRNNIIPINKFSNFSLKISYKASELPTDKQNGVYITELMKNSVISISETTIDGNSQYGVFANDIWCGTVFNDFSNNWVLKKDVIRNLLNNTLDFVEVPKTGKKVDSNLFITTSGKYRSAQILTFKYSSSNSTDIMSSASDVAAGDNFNYIYQIAEEQL